MDVATRVNLSTNNFLRACSSISFVDEVEDGSFKYLVAQRKGRLLTGEGVGRPFCYALGRFVQCRLFNQASNHVACCAVVEGSKA